MEPQDARVGSPAGSIDSLFDAQEGGSSSSPPPAPVTEVASRSVPSSIEGLYLLKDVLSSEYTERLLEQINAASYFDAPRGIDQVMLFGKARTEGEEAEQSGLPSWATELLVALESQTQERLDALTHSLLFDACSQASSNDDAALLRHTKRRKVNNAAVSTHSSISPTPNNAAKARQLILNLYAPGTGITAHVDLPARYADGIMGLSLGSGCVMDFTRLSTSAEEAEVDLASLYLPANSLVILTGPARWEWKHGIAAREGDWVLDVDQHQSGVAQARYILRKPRLSITARWMKGDAHVVGAACEATRAEVDGTASSNRVELTGQ